MKATEKRIVNACSNFLCEDDSMSMLKAYNCLKEAQNDGNGHIEARVFVEVWEGVETISVDAILECINTAIESSNIVPEFIEKIDLELLKKQKSDLLVAINDASIDIEIKESLEGILNLIDSLQDYMVDELGKDENEVFEFEN